MNKNAMLARFPRAPRKFGLMIIACVALSSSASHAASKSEIIRKTDGEVAARLSAIFRGGDLVGVSHGAPCTFSWAGTGADIRGSSGRAYRSVSWMLYSGITYNVEVITADDGSKAYAIGCDPADGWSPEHCFSVSVGPDGAVQSAGTNALSCSFQSAGTW